MSKYFTAPILILTLVVVIALVGWRGANRARNEFATELVTASNKLTEASVRLAEQGAATETLRTQLSLQKSDVASTSNRTQTLARELADTRAKQKATESQLVAVQQSVTASERAARNLQGTIRELESRIEVTQIELKSKQEQLEAAGLQLEEARKTLAQSEVDRAALLQKLSDPSVLRAQLRHAHAPGTAPRDNQSPLVIQPDGSVVLATAQPESASK